jgi:transcriptional regulator with XRE-family HTH domain
MNFRHYDPGKLKELREIKGLTQEQVAKHLGINRQTVFRAETGQSASYELLCDLCQLYNNAAVTDLLYERPLEPQAA